MYFIILIHQLLTPIFIDLENVESSHGFCLALATDYLIHKNLTMVKGFIEQELYSFRKLKNLFVLLIFLLNMPEKKPNPF